MEFTAEHFEKLLTVVESLEKIVNAPDKYQELIERIQNIESKLDKLLETGVAQPTSASKTSSESKTAGGRCEYKKTTGANAGSLCGKPTRNGCNYCNDHPEGMTRANYKKKYGDGAPTETSIQKQLKTETLSDNDDYSKVTSPAALLNIIVTTSQPHQAICKIENEKTKKVRKLTSQEKELLTKLKVSAMADKEVADVVEELEYELEVETKKTQTKKTAKSKADDSDEEEEEPKKTKDKKKKEDSEEEEEEEEKPSKASKVKSILSKKVTPKKPVSLRKRDESDSESEDGDEDD